MSRELRRAILFVVASAASSATAAAEPAVRSDWTGLYIGTHLGSAWVVNDWRSADGPFAPGGALESSFPAHFSSGGMLIQDGRPTLTGVMVTANPGTPAEFGVPVDWT